MDACLFENRGGESRLDVLALMHWDDERSSGFIPHLDMGSLLGDFSKAVFFEDPNESVRIDRKTSRRHTATSKTSVVTDCPL